MKRLFLLAIILWGALYPIQAQKANNIAKGFRDDIFDDIPIDAAHFPDVVFRDYIRVHFDLDHNDTLDPAEKTPVYIMNIKNLLIYDLKGITHFFNLHSLHCYNNPIISLDILKDMRLDTLTIRFLPYISSIDLSGHFPLREFYCDNNSGLQSLDLSGCMGLTQFRCIDNSGLQSVNLSGCTELERFVCYNNSGPQSLDLSGRTKLQAVYVCHNSGLFSLDLSGCTNLSWLESTNNSNLTTINVNGCTMLSRLEVTNNNLETISLPELPSYSNLALFWCDSNQLTSLDLSPVRRDRAFAFSCSNNKRYILQNENRTFDLNQLPNFDITKTDNWDGGFLTGTILTFIKDTVSYDYDLSHPNDLTARFTLILTDDIPNDSDDPENPDAPNDPDKPNEPDDPENPDDTPENPNAPDNPDDSDDPNDPDDSDDPDDPDDSDDPDNPWTSVQPVEAADLFSVHPVPFRQTLHIETALNLKSVSLYNMQGRLCARFEHGFNALPTAGLEPGLYLLLLETADGATYRLKAIKE